MLRVTGYRLMSAEFPPFALTSHPDDVIRAAEQRADWWGYEVDGPWTVTVQLPPQGRGGHPPQCEVTHMPPGEAKLITGCTLAWTSEYRIERA